MAERIAQDEPGKAKQALQLASELERETLRLALHDQLQERQQLRLLADAGQARANAQRARGPRSHVPAHAGLPRGRPFSGQASSTKRASPSGGWCSTSSRWRSTSESSTGDDLIQYIMQYRDVLDQLDEQLGEDFPLWDVIERFDNEQKLQEELAAHKQRIGAAPPAEAPAAAATSSADEATMPPRRFAAAARRCRLPTRRSKHVAPRSHLTAGASAIAAIAARSPLARHSSRSVDAALRLRSRRPPGRYNPKRRIVPSFCRGSAPLRPLITASVAATAGRLLLAVEMLHDGKPSCEDWAIDSVVCGDASRLAGDCGCHRGRGRRRCEAVRVIECGTDDEHRPDGRDRRGHVAATARRSPRPATITRVRIWDAATGELRTQLAGHRDWVRTVALSPDGQTLASGANDRTVCLVERVERRAAVRICRRWTNAVAAVSFHPNSQQLAVVGFSDTLRDHQHVDRPDDAATRLPVGRRAGGRVLAATASGWRWPAATDRFGCGT